MTTEPPSLPRTVSVLVNGLDGQPLQASIGFEVGGQPAATVTNARGRADIHVPQGAGDIVVTATYGKETQRAPLAASVAEYTFQFAVHEAPSWVPIAGFCCIVIAVVCLVSILFMTVGNATLRCGTAQILALLLAVCLAAGAAFLGGAATVSGGLPLPQIFTNPIQFSATGGIAIFVIVLAVIWAFVARPVCADPCSAYKSQLRISRCEPTVEGNEVKFAVTYSADAICPTHHLTLEVTEDDQLSRRLAKPMDVGTSSYQTVPVVASPPASKQGFVAIALRDMSDVLLQKATCPFTLK